MPAHMKKPPTDKTAHITWHGAHYSIPLSVIKKYKVKDPDTSLSIDNVFAELLSESTEPSLMLKGLRAKEGLTQVEFAKLIGVTQANLSSMENGKRSIGKEIAKRIQKTFGMSYQLFL